MKKNIALVLLAFSTFVVSCNNTPSSETISIDVNLSSTLGYYDSYSDYEKTLTIKEGTNIKSLPAPTPIFPEVYTFKGYGLNEFDNEIVSNDYVLKDKDNLYAKFDKKLKRDALYFLYEAKGQSYGDKELQNVISFKAYCPHSPFVDEKSYSVECNNMDALESYNIEGPSKSIFTVKIVVKENYIGNLVFKINGIVDSIGLCEVKTEAADRTIVSKHNYFAPGNEYIKAICFGSYCESFKSLGSLGVFSYLDNLRFVDFDGSLVKEIPDFTFYNCTNLKYLPYMSNLLNVGISAFNGCSNLKHFEFPEEIEKIDSFAFTNCGNLEKIKLPYMEKESGNNLFANCANLKEVDFGNCTYLGSSNFIGCNKIESIVIPNTVRFINEGAFKNCSNLHNLIFENGNNSLILSPRIFSGCSKLKSIKLPRQVNQLYDNFLSGSCVDSLDLSNVDKFLDYVELGADNPITNKKGKIIVKSNLLSKYINDSMWSKMKDVFVGI